MKQVANLVRRQANARVAHLKAQDHALVGLLFLQPYQNVYLARIGKFKRVAGVVDQHLAQAQRITLERIGYVMGHVKQQLQALVFGLVSQ